MRWIQRGMQIGQAVKNVQRLRHIIAVFAKYGFADVVDRMSLGKFLPTRLAAFAELQADRSVPERLRSAFEELGPTFVKLGQLLSTRPDLLPENYIEEFTQLQDQVQPLKYEVVRAVIEAELKKPIADIYLSLDENPLGAASIGQVHSATLLNGEKVVVKVQRPEIEKMIETDVSILGFMAGLLEKYIPETRIIGPKTIVEEFFRTLSFELDFVVEANNMSKMSENLSGMPEVVIPRVYRELSTQKILTLEKFEGIRLNDLKSIQQQGVDRKKIVQIGARAFFKTIMIDGLFHGDLHGGNLFILPGDRLGIIDFGMVGRLSQKSRDQLTAMLMSLMTEDYEMLCYQYAELGSSGPSIDFDRFQREVRHTLAPYMGLSLKDMNAGRILIEATKIATRHQIQISGDWMMVFKSILTIEGMGRTLDPDFDLLSMSEELVKDLMKNQYSFQRVSRDFLWIAKDAAALLQTLPRQIRWMFKKFNSNDFAFEIKSPELAQIRDQLEVNSRRLSLTVLVVGFVLSSTLALQFDSGRRVGDYPVLSVIYVLLGGIFLVRLFLLRR